jgi:hypothetical protein
MIIQYMRVRDGVCNVSYNHLEGLHEEFINFIGYIPISTKKVYLRALKCELEHKLRGFE